MNQETSSCYTTTGGRPEDLNAINPSSGRAQRRSITELSAQTTRETDPWSGVLALLASGKVNRVETGMQ